MHARGWSRGLVVTGGGSGMVSHAGLVLVRQLADRAALTAGLSAALPSPLGSHDRGRSSPRSSPTGSPYWLPVIPCWAAWRLCNDETTYDAPGGWIMPYGLRGV